MDKQITNLSWMRLSWAYGIQLWVSNSNIEILERFRNRYLKIIINAPWYVTNDTLHHDLNVPYVRDEIKRPGQRYADKMEEHPNATRRRSQNNTPIKKKIISKLIYLMVL